MSAQTPQTEDLPGMLAVAKALADYRCPYCGDELLRPGLFSDNVWICDWCNHAWLRESE